MTSTDSNLNSSAPLRRLVLRGGRVFDGSGADPVEDGVVVVEGERIAAIRLGTPSLHRLYLHRIK